MSNEETKFIELFTSKIDEIRKEFEAERAKMKKTMTIFLLSFGIATLSFIFGAGVVFQKVNSLEKNYDKVAEKVNILYMVAVRNGDIKFSTRGTESNGN